MAERYRLTPGAESDLADMWRFGAGRWSPEQADRYEDGLLALLGLLSTQPSMAREQPEVGTGVRMHPYRSHVIFYRPGGDGIEVLRIVHARSDWTDVLDD